jgi:hypothetical protein
MEETTIWEILELTRKNYIIHGGSTEGYKAMFINVNDGELIIAFLSNIGNRTNELKFAELIIKHIVK